MIQKRTLGCEKKTDFSQRQKQIQFFGKRTLGGGASVNQPFQSSFVMKSEKKTNSCNIKQEQVDRARPKKISDEVP